MQKTNEKLSYFTKNGLALFKICFYVKQFTETVTSVGSVRKCRTLYVLPWAGETVGSLVHMCCLKKRCQQGLSLTCQGNFSAAYWLKFGVIFLKGLFMLKEVQVTGVCVNSSSFSSFFFNERIGTNSYYLSVITVSYLFCTCGLYKRKKFLWFPWELHWVLSISIAYNYRIQCLNARYWWYLQASHCSSKEQKKFEFTVMHKFWVICEISTEMFWMLFQFFLSL